MANRRHRRVTLDKIAKLDLRSEDDRWVGQWDTAWAFPWFPPRVAEFIETGVLPSLAEAMIEAEEMK
jgi:hypothetical protein